MKRLILVAVLALAACGETAPPAAPPPPPQPVVTAPARFKIERQVYAEVGTPGVYLITDLEKGCEYITVVAASGTAMSTRLEQFGAGYRPSCNQIIPAGLVRR